MDVVIDPLDKYLLCRCPESAGTSLDNWGGPFPS